MGESIMREMVNVKEVLQNKENKFIYFYRKSALSLDEYKKVEEFAVKMANGMRVVPYKIDLDELEGALISYLKERNPKTAE